MSVRRIRGWWWVDFRHEHRRYRKRCPANAKSAAHAYEAQLRQRLARGDSLEPPPPAPTFAEFAATWFDTYVRTNNKPSEVRTKEIVLRTHLVPALGRKRMSDLGAHEVEAYKARATRAGLAAKTVNNHLAVLSKLLRCAEEWKVITSAPRIRRLSAPPAPFTFLTVAETRDLLADAAEPDWNDMVRLATRTGLRRGELIGLRWSDIDLERRLLTVRHSVVDGIEGSPKNNRLRHIPLTDEVVARLTERRTRARAADSPVFAGQHGQPVTKSQMECGLDRMCRRVGLRPIGWHALRHTFASHLAMAGVPLPSIKELLGHATIEMTMRYAHLAPSSLRAAIDLLPGVSDPPRPTWAPGGHAPHRARRVERRPLVDFQRNATQNSPP